MKTFQIFIIICLALLAVSCSNFKNENTIDDSKYQSQFIAPTNSARNRLFDLGWKFYKGEIADAQKPIFDDKQWRTVDLPHDWSIEDLTNQKEGELVGPFDKNSIGRHNTGFAVGGTGWYRKSFVIDESTTDKKFSIYFDGVYMESDVWLNGHHLGFHPNGYTPFYFTLNEYLNPAGQENIFVVRVKNHGENSRWYSGSGIYRHVWFRITNFLNIPVWGVYITTPEISDKNAKITTVVTLLNEGNLERHITVRSTIYNATGKVSNRSKKLEILGAGEKYELKQLFDIANPELWSVESPSLYTMKTELIVNEKVLDTEDTKFGIRSILFTPDNGFLLNGKSILLQGACIHHDNGPLGSAAYDRAEQRKIEILKTNGFNAIRTSHNPPSQSLLDACDRIGMLVIDEAFDRWELPKRKDDYHRFFNEWHKSDLQSMILRDRNHPSIMMWSIGNEIKERADTSGIRIAKDLVRIVKSLDITRPVTNAICDFWEFKDSGRKWEDTAPAFALLDVSGYNYALAEYENDHTNYTERIIVGTESFGKEIYENWKMAQEKPYVIGDFVWTGMDYLGEAGIGQTVTDSITMSWPWINANCGDIDLIGNKKQQSFYRDVIWDRSKLELAVEEIAPDGKEWLMSNWGWKKEHKSWTWPGKEGKLMNVNVYTKSDEVRLELNGKVIESQQANPVSKFSYTFSIPYEAGELKAIAITNGKELAVKTLRTTGSVKDVRIIPDRASITPNRNDLAYVGIELIDVNGDRVPYAKTKVRFQVDGVAEIAAVGNGNPREPKKFQSDNCNAFHGRCLVILRPTGKVGNAILTATIGDIASEKCEIRIK